MAELITIPGVDVENYYWEGCSWGDMPTKLSDAIVSSLVATDKLPADFYFRLLAYDKDERVKIAQQDILAALGMAEPSAESTDYLHGELPRCVRLPSHVGDRRSILAQVDAHYYIRADLTEAAIALDRQPYVADQSWERYVKIADHALYLTIAQPAKPERSEARRKSRYTQAMSGVVIRSDVLLELHQDADYMQQHGPVRGEILHHLLLDNYPELATAPEI